MIDDRARSFPTTWRVAAFALLMLVTLVTRGQQFGNPIVHIDEQFYRLVGERMLHGAIPYVDIWDRKPIGLFLIYMAASAIGPAPIIQYQLLAAAAALGTALTVERIAARYATAGAAFAAALLYLLYIPLLTGQGGQSPVFYNLLVALGALATIRASETSPRFMIGVGAMLAIGAALLVKTSVVFEGAFFGLVLLKLSIDARDRPTMVAGKALGWIGCALAPTLAAAAAYAWLGHFDAFWYANVLSIFRRASLEPGDSLKNAETLSLYIAPLAIAAAHGVRLRWRRRDAIAPRFVSVWLVVATIAIMLFGYWFDHYGLPLVVPAAASAASVFERPALRRWNAALLIGALLACLALPTLNQRRRGTPAQFDRLVATIRPHAAGGLLVWDNLPALYSALGTPLLSRFAFPTHLRDPNERDATGVEPQAEVRRILARSPAVIVIEQAKPGATLHESTRIILTQLTRDYHRIATVRVGRRNQLVYLRDGSR